MASLLGERNVRFHVYNVTTLVFVHVTRGHGPEPLSP